MAFDSRSVWLKTLNGVPMGVSYGSVKTQAEEPTASVKSYNAALSATEDTGSGWDATRTAWEAVSPLMGMGVINHASSTATLVDRTLTITGVAYDLDDRGRDHLTGLTAYAPDAVIVDQDALCTFVEILGIDIDLVEKTSFRKVRIYTTEPAQPLEGVTAAIYRQTSDGLVVRVNA